MTLNLSFGMVCRLLRGGLAGALAILGTSFTTGSADGGECAAPNPNTCADLTPILVSCMRDGGDFTIKYKIKNLDNLIGVTDQFKVRIGIFQDEVDFCPCKDQLTLNIDDDIPANTTSAEMTQVITVTQAACWEYYRCCFIDVDVEDQIDEDDNDNNSANKNIAEGPMITGVLTEIDAAITNYLETTTVNVDNTVTTVPAGWLVGVSPATSTIAAGGCATITLSYLAPPGAQPQVLEVVSVESQGRFTQNNLFILEAPVSAEGRSWGRIKAKYD